MKILHFAPKLQQGGATQLAADLAYALQVYEIQSLVVAPQKAFPHSPAGSHTKYQAYAPYPLPGLWGHVLKLRSIIRKYKPDILQAYGDLAITIAARACHTLPAGRRPHLVGALTGYPRLPLRPQDLAACSTITVISKQLRQFLKKPYPALIKSWVIPYGVNETLCYPTYQCTAEWVQEWQARHPELKGRFVVCVPGPISASHGTADIIPIVTTLLQQDIPAHMLVAGDTAQADPAFMATLKRRIRSAGAESCISWESSTENLRDIMCSCHAVVNLATEPEAYNRPMLEALALGRPVAGYDHGIAGEYLEAFQPVGTVPVGDCDAIADVLSQWHTYPPDPVERIPYPYRLSDTAKSYYDLYNTLS